MNTTNRQLSDAEQGQAFDQWHTLDSDYYNRLFNLSGQGLNASAGLGGLGSQISDFYSQIGNAQAAGTAARGNIWGNTISNAGNTALGNYYLNQYSR
jgi:hypothetical protein